MTYNLFCMIVTVYTWKSFHCVESSVVIDPYTQGGSNENLWRYRDLTDVTVHGTRETHDEDHIRNENQQKIRNYRGLSEFWRERKKGPSSPDETSSHSSSYGRNYLPNEERNLGYDSQQPPLEKHDIFSRQRMKWQLESEEMDREGQSLEKTSNVVEGQDSTNKYKIQESIHDRVPSLANWNYPKDHTQNLENKPDSSPYQDHNQIDNWILQRKRKMEMENQGDETILPSEDQKFTSEKETSQDDKFSKQKPKLNPVTDTVQLNTFSDHPEIPQSKDDQNQSQIQKYIKDQSSPPKSILKRPDNQLGQHQRKRVKFANQLEEYESQVSDAQPTSSLEQEPFKESTDDKIPPSINKEPLPDDVRGKFVQNVAKLKEENPKDELQGSLEENIIRLRPMRRIRPGIENNIYKGMSVEGTKSFNNLLNNQQLSLGPQEVKKNYGDGQEERGSQPKIDSSSMDKKTKPGSITPADNNIALGQEQHAVPLSKLRPTAGTHTRPMPGHPQRRPTERLQHASTPQNGLPAKHRKESQISHMFGKIGNIFGSKKKKTALLNYPSGKRPTVELNKRPNRPPIHSNHNSKSTSGPGKKQTSQSVRPSSKADTVRQPDRVSKKTRLENDLSSERQENKLIGGGGSKGNTNKPNLNRVPPVKNNKEISENIQQLSSVSEHASSGSGVTINDPGKSIVLPHRRRKPGSKDSESDQEQQTVLLSKLKPTKGIQSSPRPLHPQGRPTKQLQHTSSSNRLSPLKNKKLNGSNGLLNKVGNFFGFKKKETNAAKENSFEKAPPRRIQRRPDRQANPKPDNSKTTSTPERKKINALFGPNLKTSTGLKPSRNHPPKSGENGKPPPKKPVLAKQPRPEEAKRYTHAVSDQQPKLNREKGKLGQTGDSTKPQRHSSPGKPQATTHQSGKKPPERSRKRSQNDGEGRSGGRFGAMASKIKKALNIGSSQSRGNLHGSRTGVNGHPQRHLSPTKSAEKEPPGGPERARTPRSRPPVHQRDGPGPKAAVSQSTTDGRPRQSVPRRKPGTK